MPNDLGFQSFDEMRSLAASPEGANRGYQSFDEMVALSSGDGDKDKEKQEERRSRPKIGLAERLRLERKAETGDDASTLEAVGAQLTLGVQPVVDVIRKSALQQLAAGKKKTFFRGEVPFSELPDYEVSNMAKFANLDMPLMDSPLKQWDKTNGAEIADPKERRAERAKFIQSEATNELKRKLQNKIDAGRELSGRDKTLWAKLGGGFVNNAGYTGAFMVGAPMAIGTSVARRFGDLQTDEQTLVDGEIVTVDKGDEQGTAMSKGAAGGTAEYLIEKYGTEAAGAVLKGTFGKIPFVGAALSKAGGTAVGKTIANVAKKFNRLGEITGKQNLAGEIMAEELPQQILDAGIGLDKRESAKLMGIGSDTAESFKSFVKPENVGNMALEMLLMQSVQGTAAGVSYYDTYSKDRNRVDGTLAAFGADPGLLKKASLQEKREVLATLGHRLTPEKATLVLERLGNKADGLYKSITEQEGYDFDAKKNGITSAFRLPAPGEGDGRERLPDGSMLYDHKESGIGIVEHPDGRATVYDRDGDMQEFKTLGEAVKSAHGLSVRNQVIDMRRGQKAKFVEATARRLAGGVNVRVHNTTEDLLADVPEAAQSPDFEANPSGMALGDTIHVVLDNIETPRGVVSTILHEAGVHAGLNNVLKGEEKDKFLANLGDGAVDTYKRLAAKTGYLQGAHNSEEALAYMYEQRLANPTGYQRAVKWTHDRLRQVNPNYKFTDADIEVMMADAQRSVRNGANGSVALPAPEADKGKAREAAEQNAYERKALELEESYPAQTPVEPYDRERGAAPVAAAGTPAVDLNAESQKRMAEDPQAWIESLRAAKGDIGKAAKVYDSVREDAAGTAEAETTPEEQPFDEQKFIDKAASLDKPWYNALAKEFGAPAKPVRGATEPYETLSLASDMLRRTAEKSRDPAQLARVLKEADGLPDESRIADDVANNPYSDDATFEKAITNERNLAMVNEETYIPAMRKRRAEMLAQIEENKKTAQPPSPAPEVKTADVAQPTPTAKKAQAQESANPAEADAQEGAQDRAGSKAAEPVSAQGDVAAKPVESKQDAKDQPPVPPNPEDNMTKAEAEALQAEYKALYAKNYGSDKRQKPDSNLEEVNRMVVIKDQIDKANFNWSQAQKKFKKEQTEYWAKKHGYYDGQHVEVKDLGDGTWVKKTVLGADERGLVISTPNGDRVFPLEMVRPITINGKEPWQMTQAEWDAASRFYRSGKTKNVELPTGQKVIIRNEATPTTFLEVSKDFLGNLRKDYLDAMRERGKEIPAEADNQQPSEPAQGDKAPAVGKEANVPTKAEKTAKPTAKAPELMTPEEYVLQKSGGEDAGAMRGFYEQGYVNSVSDALNAHRDVNASSVDRILSLDQIRKSIKGYVRSGDRYVFKGDKVPPQPRQSIDKVSSQQVREQVDKNTAAQTESSAKAERAGFDAAVKAKFWATGTNRMRADKAKAIKDGNELKRIGGEFETFWREEKAKADRMKAAGKVKALAEAVGREEAAATVEESKPSAVQPTVNDGSVKWTPENQLLTVADRIETLRATDVYRLLSETPEQYRYQMRDFINKGHSDNQRIQDEVRKAMKSLTDTPVVTEKADAPVDKVAEKWSALKRGERIAVSNDDLDEIEKRFEDDPDIRRLASTAFSAKSYEAFLKPAAVQPTEEAAAADTAPSVSKIVSKENGREIGVSVEKVDNPVLDALRKEVEEKIARGEKVPIDTLEKFPWLAADEVIKPYVQSLVGMSDKQLQKEEKKAADELNRFADNNKAIMPDGTPNPALGNRAYFEVSNKLTAIDREIKRRSGQVIVTKKELDAAKDTPNVASATPDVSPSTADAAVKVETEPDGDKTVSVPSKDKPSITPKEQKKFLLAEIDKAIEAAPDEAKAFDRTAKQDEAQSDYVSIVGENYPLGKKPTLPYNATPEDKAEHEDKMRVYGSTASNKLDPLFDKYGIPEMSPESKGYLNIDGTMAGVSPSKRYPIETRYGYLEAELNGLRGDKYPTVTIEVPGDGEFTVINDKSHLSVFRDMAKKRFPASMFEPSANEKKALPEPHAPVRLGRTVGFDAMTAEIKALLQPFASKDPTRKPILNPHWNGAAGEAVATDGRRLAVMIGKKNAKPKKDDSGYPNYTQVVPGYKEGKVPNPDAADALEVKVDSEKLARKLTQALSLYKDVEKASPTVKLWLTADGKIEVTTEFSETRSIKDTGGSYSSLGDTPGFELGIYNPEYLMDALTFLRKTGNETPVMYASGRGSPMIMAGKSEYVIQMPLRMDGSGRANDTHVAEYAKWKAKQDGALDSKGRTPEQVAGLKKMAAAVKEATSGGESILPKPKQEGVADFVAAEIPQSPDGDYQIYITKVKTPDGSYVDRFAVPDRDHKNKPGFGDSLHATLEEAVKEAQNKRTRDVEEVKRNADADAAKRKAAEAKSVKDDIDGFDAGMTPMQRGKTIQELNAPVNLDGEITTRKAFIRRAVENGTARPEADERDAVAEWSRTKFNRASQAEQDEHARKVKEGGKKTVYLVGGYDLGHTAFKYANHLIAKASGESALPKPAEQAETTDTPKPDASAQAPTAAAQAPEEQPLPNKGVQHAIDRSLAAASIIRGKVDKKAFESAYSTLRTHSDKTGVEVPSLGTYFDADEYRRIADTVTMGIAKKYGSFPTEELRAKRDAANASTPAKSVRIIPHKDVPSSKIKNMDAMPRGTGARYLEVTEGENGDWIAKQWRRTPVTSGNRSALLDFDAPASPSQSPGKLEDFGEKIGGARKDIASFAKSELTDDDIAKKSFSEIWPKADVDAIEDDGLAAIAHAIRDSVPSKPRRPFRLRNWVEQVKTVKTLMGHAQEMGRDEFLKKLSDNRVLAQLVNKIKLLGMVKRENWGRIGKVEYYPEAYSYDKAGNQIKKPYASADVDGNYHASATSVEELADSVNKRLEGDAPEKRMEFEIRGTPSKGYFINKKGDPLYRKLKTFTGTDQNEVIVQARKFVNEEYDALVRAWEDVKDSDNVKETDVRRDENRPRTGKDHRNGKSATPEMFTEAFGFRGVEFGNWVSQGKNMKERQGMLDASYDALMDLADIMGVPTRAISLNGTLGLGLGSRGHGWASAHFEPGTLVINLTKTRGAGSLAHEFFHAMDNYFQRQRGTPSGSNSADYYITYNPESYYEHSATRQRLSPKLFASVRLNNPDDWKRIDGVRPEVEQAFVDLVKALNDSPMNKRAALIDKGKSGGYWSRIIERAARSFESYVIAKMQQKGYQNDYLANVVDVKDFARDPGRYPYLLAEELAPVEKAFDGLFSTLKTKETAKGVAMFRRNDAVLSFQLDQSGAGIYDQSRKLIPVKEVPDEIQRAVGTLREGVAELLEPGEAAPSLQVVEPVYDAQTLSGKTLERGAHRGLESVGEPMFRRSDAEVDAAYMKAVESGDMETAQRMVDEAAKAAGYTVGKVYHGTKEAFTVFNRDMIGTATDNGFLGRGFYFSTDSVYATQYAGVGGRVIEAYLKAEQPYPIEKDELDRMIAAADAGDVDTLDDFPRELTGNDYDSVIYDDQVMVLNPDQVKSADPVTRDDAGNVIPLSKRFNEASDDIRFRRSDADIDAMMAEIEREDVADNFRAMPSTNTKARDMQADVQVSYAYNLEPKTVQQMQDQARGIYERDKKKAQLDLLAGRTDSGIVNTDARRMATDKLAVDDMTMDAVNSPDDDGKAATAMLAIWRWYERGTDVARALRLRFDPVDTPEGRRAWIMRTLLAPTRAEAEIIRRAKTTNEAISALKAKAKHARSVLKKLRAKNIDIPGLTAAQLMDDVFVAGIMRDISTARSGWGDMVHEWWRNAILSAPTTQIVNTVGNAGNAALEAFVQRPVEALINTFAKNDRAATFRSVGAMYRSVVPSMRAANEAFIKAWRTEKPVSGDAAKVEESGAAIPGTFGKQVRIPQRIMLATDEWFKTVFMAMLTADYATREFDRLVTEGKQSESNRDAYVRAQVDTGSSAYAKAWEETLRWSFQQKPGHMAGAIMNWRNDPDFGFWLKFIFPFVRTPANIISSGLRKTPLNAVPYVYKAATGKYSKEDAFRLGAEQAVGMAFMAVLYAMMKGDDDDPLNRPRITGSRKASAFSPKGMKEAEMRDYPPMSVRVGDRWVSYKRLEPFATMASTMVDALTAWEQATSGHSSDIPATLFASIRGNLADKTFLQGVGNLVSIMEGDEFAMSRAVTGTLAGFNPNIVRSTVRAFDPYIRETRTQEKGALKKFASRLAYQAYPAESNAPPPKIGKDGNPVEREGGGVYNSIVPFSVQAADKTTKADAMVKRYNESVPEDKRWWPSSPEPSEVSFGREKIRMTDEEHAEYKRVAGKIAERRLSAVSFNYANPTERDRDRMKDIYEGARSAARDRMRPAVIRRWKAERAVDGKGE